MKENGKASRKTFRIRLEEMASVLREEILSGRRAVGEFLPSELDLTKQFQLSNKSVRKALDMLVEEGLIEKIPKVGNRVCAPTDEKKTQVRIGYHPTTNDETALSEMLAAFHESHPHIQVQTVEIPSNFHNSVQEYLDADLLDVFTINQWTFMELIENGTVDLLEPCEPNPGIYPFLTHAFTHNGLNRVQPFSFSPVILCYNRDHFQEQGLSEPYSGWTWDDLLEHAGKLAVENERFGFYFHLLSQNRWPIFPLQSGMGFERGEDGRYRICGSPLSESLEMCRKIIYMPNVFPTMLSASNADAEELFRNGKVSMIMTSYFGLNRIKDASLSYDIAPLPFLNEARTLLVIIGLAVSRKSKVKEAARQVVEFLQSAEAQLIMRKHTLSIPADKSAAEWKGEERIERPSRYNMYREIVPTFRLLSDLKLNSRQLSEVLQEAKLYWSKLQDISVTCARIEEVL
ncbi:extracellular solute-binding protein [Paenibacillus sp. CC-CFT747]|nr:extracellular solute-binding protein [Paenibacillus sp. CC-CFT747]